MEHLRRAAQLFGAAQAQRDASGSQMGVNEPEEYERYVTRLQAIMEDKDREAAWTEGRMLTLDQAIAEGIK